MTIIKQRSVTDKSHQKNLRNYINNDAKVLLRDAQNMENCANLKAWASYMSATRDEFGHNKAARKGKDGKEAANTILYHQILAFLPDECDVNGGQLSPKDCMTYAKEYAQKHYPNQEIVFALHNEYCKEDSTHRYAVHMVINRSDLETGNRLNEGRGETAKRMRAKRVRLLDEAWNLQQVEEGKENSRVHKKQPSKIEKAIKERGEKSYKTNLRELCREAATRAKNIFEYRELLESWGVDTQFRNGRMYATDTDNARYSFSVTKLDAALNPDGLEKVFYKNVAASIHEKAQAVRAAQENEQAEGKRIQTLKSAYLAEAREAYLDYRRMAHEMEGTSFNTFPKMRLKKPPEEIAHDTEVKRAVLAYWRGADELRRQLASSVPYARRKTGTEKGGTEQPRSMEQNNISKQQEKTKENR